MKTMTNVFALGAVAALTAPAAFAAAGEPWYLNTTYWATGVLIIFLLFVGRLGAFGAVGKMLDSRANEIQRELDQAQKLREEASAMLKEAEKRQQDAADQADAIVRQAEADAKALMAQAEKDLTDMVARREAQVEARIARAEEEATRAVKQIAADAATRAAADIVRASADKSGGSETFKTALGQIKTAL